MAYGVTEIVVTIIIMSLVALCDGVWRHKNSCDNHYHEFGGAV